MPNTLSMMMTGKSCILGLFNERHLSCKHIHWVTRITETHATYIEELGFSFPLVHVVIETGTFNSNLSFTLG